MKNLIYAICIFSIFAFSADGQPKAKNKDPKQDDSAVEKTTSRWKSTLDLLVQEAGTINPKEKRPNALAEVADAYWNLDKQIAKNLFAEASDTALLLEKKEDRAKSFRYVLNLVTRRDSTLAKSLIAEAEKSGKLKDDIEDASIETAREILDEDILKSAELAEKIAPFGLKYGNAMSLIFQIAKKNPDLANRVYQVYLNKVLADENFPLELSVYLVGYGFGHGDYYGLISDESSVGASLVMPEPLAVNRSQANNFLSYLFRRINRDLQNSALTPENQFKKMVALFAIDYVIDDAALLSPNTLTNWEELRQQAAIGFTSAQLEQVSSIIRQIKETRESIKRRSENPEKAAADREISEEEIENLSDVCRRDMLYTKNAVNALGVKNFNKAKKWIDKIEDIKREEVIDTYFHFNFAEHLAGKKQWDEVPEHARKVSDNRLKTILLVQLARDAVEQKQTETALGWLQDSYKLSKKLESIEERQSLLFELASIHPQNSEARDLFYEAVKMFNRSSKEDSKNFSFLIKIPLSCADDGEWFGGSSSLKNGNLLASLSVLAAKEAEALMPSVQNLENASIKVKAVSLLIKKALESEKTSKNSLK